MTEIKITPLRYMILMERSNLPGDVKYIYAIVNAIGDFALQEKRKF